MLKLDILFLVLFNFPTFGKFFLHGNSFLINLLNVFMALKFMVYVRVSDLTND